MYLAPFLILAGLLVALFAYRSVLKRKAERPYKIIVLGPSNAGKTVFLATLFNRLRIQGLDTGFFVDVEPEQQIRLLEYLDQIADPRKDFPPGNALSDMTEWQFDCKVKTAQGIYDIMRFSYLDYAGERINNLYKREKGISIVSQEFRDLLKDANALLGILDGRELLKYMNNKDIDKFHRDYIDNILPLLQEANKPVHLIITKWDLLESNFSLREIITRLKEYRPFRDFVDVHARFAPLRLIPVSAIGKRFAELQPDGSMRKKPGGMLEPEQVEMPLACVLHDYLAYQIPVDKKVWSSRMKKIAASGNIFKLIAILPVFLFWLPKVFTLSVSGPYGISFQVFLDGIFQLVQGSQRTGSNRGTEIRNKKEAMRQTMHSFWHLQTKLERSFPASNLSRPNNEYNQ